MAQNKYSVVIDFLLQFTNDPSKLNALAEQTKKILGTIEPDIEFNVDDFKNQLKGVAEYMKSFSVSADDLQKAFDNIDVEMNGEAAKKTLNELLNMSKDFDNIDLSEFEKALEDMSAEDIDKFQKSLEDLMENFDADVAEKFGKEMSEAMKNGRVEIEKIIGKGKEQLILMESNGKKGTDAYNKIEKEIKEAEKALDNLNNTSGKTGKSFGERMATFGLAAQGLNTLVDTVSQISEPFAQLDTATQSMKTLGDEAAEMAPRLREAAITMSKDLPFGAAEIQAAMTDALASGVQGGEEGLKNFAETASKLAIGGGAELGSVVKGLGATLNAFGETSEETGRYADYMFNIVNAGVTTIDELNSNLSGVTPTAAAMGLSFDKVGGSLALMTQKGVPTAQSVTKLNSLLVELAKPSAGVSSALEAAGISMEDFHKMIADDDLVGALSTLQKGFEKTGKTATQSFSSSEAGAAFNILMGDVNMLQESLDFVSNTVGSTENAYEKMGDSIEVKTKQMKASMDAFIIGTVDSLGSFGPAFITFSQSLSSIAPQITALSGLNSIIPEGTLDKVKNLSVSFGKNLAGGLGIATTGMKAFTVSLMTNPIVLTAAAVAGLVVGLSALSDALHETAAEKLEQVKAEKESLQIQTETVKKQETLAQRNMNLVSTFKEMGASAMQNKELMLSLAKAYPGVIDMTKSYGWNLNQLMEASNKTEGELSKMSEQLSNLELKRIDLQLKEFKVEAGVAKEEVENALTDALISDKTWLNPVGKAGEFLGEALFGSSLSRDQAEKSVKKYTDALYKASTEDEVRQAGLNFQMALYDDESFAAMSEEQKNQQVANIDKMMESLINSKKYAAEMDGKFAKERLSQGKSEEDVIKAIMKERKKNRDEAEKIVKAAKEELKTAKNTKQELDEQAKRRELLGTLASEQLKGATEEYGKATDEITTLEIKRKEAIASGNKEKAKEYEQELKNLDVTASSSRKKIDSIQKVQEAVRKRYEKEKQESKPALDIVKEKMGYYEREKQYLIQIAEIDARRQKLKIGQDVNEVDSYKLALEKLNVQKQINAEWIKELQAKNLIQEADNEFGFEPSVNLKKEQKEEIISQLRAIKLSLESSEVAVLDYDIDISKAKEELEKELESMKLDDLKFKIETDSLEPEEFDKIKENLRIKTGEIEALLEASKNRITAIEEQKRKELQKDGISDEQIKQLSTKFDLELNLEQKNNIELVKLQTENSEKRNEILNSYFDSRFEITNTRLEKELQKFQENYDKQLESIGELTAAWDNATNMRYDKEQSSSISALDSEKERKLKQLEALSQAEMFSTINLEKRKAEIEEEYQNKRYEQEEEFRKKRIVQEALSKGLQVEIERKKQLDISSIQLEQIQAELEMLESKEINGQKLSISEKMRVSELESMLDKVTDVITTKSNTWDSLYSVAGESISSGITELFAGNSEAMVESFRDLLGQLFGVAAEALYVKIDEAVLSLVLDYLSKSFGDPLTKLAFAPILQATARGAIRALANPIIEGLLSFSTGGRIDQPTMAVIGDGSRLGSINREWIFNDEQLRQVVGMASMNSSTQITKELRNVRDAVSQQKLVMEVQGEQLRILMKRAEISNRARAF